MRWYAVLTKARREWLAQRNLMFQGYETFYPHYEEWTTPTRAKPRLVKKPYLTRYVFAGMNGLPHQSIYNINNTIGVSTAVYCGMAALEIAKSVMDELMARADASGRICTGEVKRPVFPGKVGDRIRFGEGSPLFGFVAAIKRIDRSGKLMVEVEKMLGDQRLVSIDRADVGEILSN